ncbi:MAG: iron-sulfur cluster biosynthesis protein [Aerococcaceae bacterium]|nr:iron-sulfur cluster biosynthesis protein [Aerococcaceae bacterium]
MKLIIEPQAAAWFKEEVGLPEGSGVRFLVKVYGCSPVNSGFSLAMETNYPANPSVSVRAENGVHFFIEEQDEWFFDGHDLQVSYNETLKEPKYLYLKDGVAIND